VIILLYVCAFWLSTVFVHSAVMKVLDYRSAAHAIAAYSFRPVQLSVAVGWALPWAEAAIGGAFLAGLAMGDEAAVRGSAAAAFAMAATFGAAAWSVLRRGQRALPCGCSGRQSDPVGPTTLLRAVLMALASSAVVVYSLIGRTPNVSWPVAALAGLAAIAPGVLMRLARLRRDWRRHGIRQRIGVETA
jgi:hypothetical protein